MMNFSKAKELVIDLAEQGLEDMDIIIILHEVLPKTLAEEVLQDCRKDGLI
jgi:hypothetical protein